MGILILIECIGYQLYTSLLLYNLYEAYIVKTSQFFTNKSLEKSYFITSFVLVWFIIKWVVSVIVNTGCMDSLSSRDGDCVDIVTSTPSLIIVYYKMCVLIHNGNTVDKF